MYTVNNHSYHYERRQPLGERIKFRVYTVAPKKVQVSEYRDSPHETLRRIANKVQDSQDNADYCYDVRRFAVAILRNTGRMDMADAEKISAIYHWAIANMSYVNDPAFNELVHSAEVLLDEYDKTGVIHGDCDDFTLLICALLLAVGVPCRARMIKVAHPVTGEMKWAHIYPMALDRDTGQWIAMDATEKDKFLGWEPPEGQNLAWRKDWNFA